MIEITVKVSNEEKTMKKKLMHYGELNLSLEDPFIQSLVSEAQKEFVDKAEDVVITCKMTVPLPA